jgi:miniconductance mechanosensitive channel
MRELILKWIARFYDLDNVSSLKNLLQQDDHLWHSIGWMLFLLTCTVIVSLAIWWLTKEVLVSFVNSFAKRTKTEFDDILVQKKFFNILAHLLPLLLLDYFFSIVFFTFPNTLEFADRINEVLIALVVLIAIRRFFNTVGEFMRRKPSLEGKPIRSYVQTVNIVVTIFFSIIILSLLTGQSPTFFLTSIGAMTAIIILVFKDTILGFVGSIQMAANDMVRVGDWVTMEKYGADGDVVEITLNTVKVQNWDRTITTIPTYNFISESFKNWRGMAESGGRRISRNVHIQIDSVKFASPRLLEKLKEVNHLKPFIEEREKEIKAYNEKNGLSQDQINARKQTNIGLFRRYLEFYLKNHERVHQGMTLMVRQLANDERGVPVQIYCFTNTIVWGEYEEIMGDIFDHIFAVTKEFELSIHEAPSGNDVRFLAEKLK